MTREPGHYFIRHGCAQSEARHKTHQKESDVLVNDAVFYLIIKQEKRFQNHSQKPGCGNQQDAAESGTPAAEKKDDGQRRQ